jgi:cytochrome oxidase assembly protein ShyY1
VPDRRKGSARSRDTLSVVAAVVVFAIGTTLAALLTWQAVERDRDRSTDLAELRRDVSHQQTPCRLTADESVPDKPQGGVALPPILLT